MIWLKCRVGRVGKGEEGCGDCFAMVGREGLRTSEQVEDRG